MKLLVLAAWEPELTHFRDLARGMDELRIDVAGVGMVEAAVGTARAIARHDPTHALFVGTCGALAADLRPLDVVAGVTAQLVGDELPEAMPSQGRFDDDLRNLFATSTRSVGIASTLGITVDDAAARRLRPKGEVEHLEAFSFLRACTEAMVPCAIVLAVANAVGARGRQEWLENHEAASARAADVVFRCLRSSTTERSPV
jgi:nucleoside phosphorylase